MTPPTEPVGMTEPCVYAAYDDAGQLLYVGSSENLYRRMEWHRAYSRVLDTAHIEKVPFVTITDARRVEAEMYLSLNDTLAQSAFDKFRIAVVAQRDMECDIYRIVHSVGLSVTRDRIEGGVRAVGTLVRVYKRGGPKVLKRTLVIIRDAYGTPGLEAQVIDGIGFLCDRYNGDLEDQLAVAKLSNIHGGVNGLLNKAEVIRRQTGQPLGQSVAAAAVEVINHGLGPRSSKRLSSWFREEAA